MLSEPITMARIRGRSARDFDRQLARAGITLQCERKFQPNVLAHLSADAVIYHRKDKDHELPMDDIGWLTHASDEPMAVLEAAGINIEADPSQNTVRFRVKRGRALCLHIIPGDDELTALVRDVTFVRNEEAWECTKVVYAE